MWCTLSLYVFVLIFPTSRNNHLCSTCSPVAMFLLMFQCRGFTTNFPYVSITSVFSNMCFSQFSCFLKPSLAVYMFRTDMFQCPCVSQIYPHVRFVTLPLGTPVPMITVSEMERLRSEYIFDIKKYAMSYGDIWNTYHIIKRVEAKLMEYDSKAYSNIRYEMSLSRKKLFLKNDYFLS